MADLIKYRVCLPPGSDPTRGPGWTDLWVREGTDDEDVINEVWVQDVYHLRGVTISRDDDDLNAVESTRVLDIGAHIGIFTAYLARLFPHVYITAVEPDADNFELLVRNTEPFRNRVDCYRGAVGRQPGTVRLEGGGGTGHTVYTPDGSVEQTTLDALIGPTDEVAYLKIDTEGAEFDIIAGSYQLHRVDLIAMEWHSTGMCAWLDQERSLERHGALVSRLAYTHDVTVLGHPDVGGMLYAHRYPG